MKREKTPKGNTHKVETVVSGANPDRFEFPYGIPQQVKKLGNTNAAFERFFDQDGDGVRENDKHD